MLLTITSTAPDATDLGHLLHKHPDRVQRFDLPVGRAHVFYPEAADDRCTAALLLEVDPIALVRGRRLGGDGFALGQYVNDRPYAASSMLAVAIGRVFSSALHGRCDARPDLAATPLPLEVLVPAVPSPEGPGLLERLFAPLGWDVAAGTAPLDPEIPRWGDAPYVDLTLRGTLVLADALRQLYLLLPVLDGAKHYWVGDDEVDKLVRVGGGWLASHPERELIVRRYLARQRSLVLDATARLAALDDSPDVDPSPAGGGDESGGDGASPSVPFPTAARPLAGLRRTAVIDQLRRIGAHRVVDLGCGEGALLRDLIADTTFTQILGVDVSDRALARAQKRLALDRMSDHQRSRVSLLQSSVTYTDSRLVGFDAIVLMEVIEHLDADRLPALERSVFGHARPRTVVVTTPNADFNPLYPGLPAGAMRHPDHRFEFSRAEFASWSGRVAREFGYAAELLDVGEEDARRGAPTQLATFTRRAPDHGADDEADPAGGGA